MRLLLAGGESTSPIGRTAGFRSSIPTESFSPSGNTSVRSGLDITPDQRIWAAGGARVILLNLEGQILGSLAGAGKLPGQVQSAHAIAAGSGGEVYVGELNWQVKKFVKK